MPISRELRMPGGVAELHARYCAARDGLQAADATCVLDDALFAFAEAAAEAVIREPSACPRDTALKLDVLRTWYLADFWSDACWDDGAAQAVRATFEELDRTLSTGSSAPQAARPLERAEAS